MAHLGFCALGFLQSILDCDYGFCKKLQRAPAAALFAGRQGKAGQGGETNVVSLSLSLSLPLATLSLAAKFFFLHNSVTL